MTTVFQEMAWIQLLILLTLWGFAIDTLVRRRRQRQPKPATDNRPVNQVLTVFGYICGAVAVFVVVILVLAWLTQS